VHDVLRALVNPHLRAAMPADELLRLTGILSSAMHGVFVLSAILALGALIVAALVPADRRDHTARSPSG
jgi:tetrahydromethanopterin S-methyltransferase subunit B